MIIRTTSYPRAALIGNPSDGYFGKTISFVFRNFKAEVVLYESPELEIQQQERDRSTYRSIKALWDDVNLYGYYGGIRLLKATIKKFFQYCTEQRVDLGTRNFTIRYSTDIPTRLGMAGSSAIITACVKALMRFYNIQIPPPILANLVLSVETDELGIGAGLQDRVAQAYEKPVMMDFDRTVMERQGFGVYETFNPSLLPPLYIAYRSSLSEGSEVLHNNLRERFDRGDPEVVKAMQRFGAITQMTRQCLESGQVEEIRKLMDQNFDLRHSICEISQANLEMIRLARSVGASAKFTGSGGAIIGCYSDETTYERLAEVFARQEITLIKPDIVS